MFVLCVCVCAGVQQRAMSMNQKKCIRKCFSDSQTFIKTITKGVSLFFSSTVSHLHEDLVQKREAAAAAAVLRQISSWLRRPKVAGKRTLRLGGSQLGATVSILIQTVCTCQALRASWGGRRSLDL